MKRLVLLLATLMLAMPASSQVITKALPKLRLGIKVGVNYQSNDFVGKEIAIYDIKPGTGFVVGAQADLKWNHFGIHPELLYSHLSLDTEIPNSQGDPGVRLNRIDLPILLEYELFGIINLQAGPSFALYTGTGGKCTVMTGLKESLSAKWDFKRPPVGYVVGADARIWKFNFAVRYCGMFGKGEFDGIAAGESTMHGFQATLGFYF